MSWGQPAAPRRRWHLGGGMDGGGTTAGMTAVPGGVAADMDKRVDVAERLRALRRDTAERRLALRRDFDRFVEAAQSVSTDDEHDPEGAGLAFERAQVAALL